MILMKTRGEKVVVAMSGGVDSSVAACLLAEQGYEVVGLFMRVGATQASEPWSDGATKARRHEGTEYLSRDREGAELKCDGATKARRHEGTEYPSRDRQSDQGGSFVPEVSPAGETQGEGVGINCRLSNGDSRLDEVDVRGINRAISRSRAESSDIDGSRELEFAARGEPPLIPPLQGGKQNTQSATMNNGVPRARQGCCSASDAGDARFVAGMLGVPFYALNFEKDFDRIIDYFADEYARGRTPNPCVMCNDRLKFGRLFEYADAVGAKYVATGHYARIGRRGGESVLMRGVDHKKDQSYVLFGLRRAALDRLMFPIGDLTKGEVRRLAGKFGLPNRDKPDSVEICFVPDRDYARVVRERRPEAFAAGEVVDSAGSVIGRHGGIAHYTIGQRRGLRIAAGRPVYVTRLDVLNNRVVLGDGDELLCGALVAERVNLLVSGLSGEFQAHVKIRYLHEATPATVRLLDEGRARVVFDEPQRAVTPGQAVVFYDGDAVLGGGWIAGNDE